MTFNTVGLTVQHMDTSAVTADTLTAVPSGVPGLYLVTAGFGKAVHLYQPLRANATNPYGLGYTMCGSRSDLSPAIGASASTCRRCAARRD